MKKWVIKHNTIEYILMLVGYILIIILTYINGTAALVAAGATDVFAQLLYVAWLGIMGGLIYKTVYEAWEYGRTPEEARTVSPTHFFRWLALTIILGLGAYILVISILDWGSISLGGYFRWDILTNFIIIPLPIMVVIHILAEWQMQRRIPSGYVRTPKRKQTLKDALEARRKRRNG